ncbi:MAG: CopG family transcriptional regulator [Microcoleus sp. CAN_BIN18]|nr:CopG family transcriptional regulator [Microcoleus sp. CAN_BIN18]
MKQLSVRVSDLEFQEIQDYCRNRERTQNDVIREAIRKFLENEKQSRGL